MGQCDYERVHIHYARKMKIKGQKDLGQENRTIFLPEIFFAFQMVSPQADPAGAANDVS
jgi:hypothetical protein